MLSLAQIHAEAVRAGARAAQKDRKPFIVWPEDLQLWQAQVANGGAPKFPFPFIGDYVPAGWTKGQQFFVDSSGMGTEGEPALTIGQFVALVREGKGYAVVEAGEFQVYVAEFEPPVHPSAVEIKAQDEEDEEWDAHRRNPGFCGKCGGQCYFDDEGRRIVANQNNEAQVAERKT